MMRLPRMVLIAIHAGVPSGLTPCWASQADTLAGLQRRILRLTRVVGWGTLPSRHS
jgi:hypothetical protein